MISELSWEEVLHPKGEETYCLALASGRCYRFQAVRRIWDNLDIDPASLSVDTGSAVCPLRFTVDARVELGMSAPTEAMFLRELSNTLRQDVELLRLYGNQDASDLIALPSSKLHAALEGHPKAVANKGRLGWGTSDLAAYAPEYGQPIQLFWLAADPARLRLGHSGTTGDKDLLLRAIGTESTEILRQTARTAGVSDDYVLMPVHPWQWANYLEQAFATELSEGHLVPLGQLGPGFLATPSLRTLTPADGGPYDVKLSLSILNTSAWRGMPGKYIAHGGTISDWLGDLVENDPLLKASVTVLHEAFGAWYCHPVLADCPDAPYRHHEMLGAIWRENVDHRMASGQNAIMAGALFHTGACGTPLALAYARKAGMTLETWLAKLFEVTVVPLWHFLCRYGVGFIAHGQNVIVVLEANVPVGMAIKDFQGDLDLVDQDIPELTGLDPAVRALLPRKPPAYIVHDIQTAHFVTVLRFLSAGLARADALEEDRFYAILRQVLKNYAALHPELADRQLLFDLFQTKMPKVCINKVRFAIGYEDSAERPMPARGTDLLNPLSMA